MENVVSVELSIGSRTIRRPAADQWLYVAMAVVFVLIALLGFLPTSTELVARVLAGEAPRPPLILHAHAAVMAAWLVLLLVQTVLMAKDNPRLHRRLGTASFVLAPLMLAAMIAIVVRRFELLASLPADLDAAAVAQATRMAFNLTLINAGSLLLFPVFYVWAIVARRRDQDSHKRIMILATLVLMSPAIGRMVAVHPILPDFGLNGADARHLYVLLLLLPVLVHDTLRLGAPHRAYVLGLVPVIAYMTAAHFLWQV